jgi:hypothetical protein
VVICVLGVESLARERVVETLLERVPRVAVEVSGRVWADGKGIRSDDLGSGIVARFRELGAGEVRCGLGTVPVTAYAAARSVGESGGVAAGAGEARAWLAPFGLDVLEPEESLRRLLEGVGIETCGQLAEVPREAVEVRFGGEAVVVWRRSRAEDERRLFRAVVSNHPKASLDFIDYVVTDPERLVFTANALLGGLSETLAGRGAHARRMELELPLANGEVWRKRLRPARPTASRSVWLRLVRAEIERLTVPDAVAGVSLEILETESASVIQGDLFDAGFATVPVVEAALARLIEAQGPVVVRAERSAHPLAERRTDFVAVEPERLVEHDSMNRRAAGAEVGALTGEGERERGEVGLVLQLLREPRPIAVETTVRRDHALPARYRDGEWKRFATVAGPDRVSGGQWDSPYAREYFRGITTEGTLVWIYRDGRDDRWYLHGWWD